MSWYGQQPKGASEYASLRALGAGDRKALEKEVKDLLEKGDITRVDIIVLAAACLTGDAYNIVANWMIWMEEGDLKYKRVRLELIARFAKGFRNTIENSGSAVALLSFMGGKHSHKKEFAEQDEADEEGKTIPLGPAWGPHP